MKIAVEWFDQIDHIKFSLATASLSLTQTILHALYKTIGKSIEFKTASHNKDCIEIIGQNSLIMMMYLNQTSNKIQRDFYRIKSSIISVPFKDVSTTQDDEWVSIQNPSRIKFEFQDIENRKCEEIKDIYETSLAHAFSIETSYKTVSGVFNSIRFKYAQ